MENFPLDIETLAGIRRAQQLPDGRISVRMGRAVFTPEKIPVRLPGERVVGQEVFVGGKKQCITCVSMGNPHCVIFADDLRKLEIKTAGAAIERDPLFPEGVNVEIVQVLDRRTIRMRVWERGSGETLACGTGACAAAVAAIENGFCDREAEITVHLPGGELCVCCQNGEVTLSGEAREVFTGEIDLEDM